MRRNDCPRWIGICSKGKRILDEEEIRALWAATDEMGSFGALVKVLLLTDQRREKVATMRWDDLATASGAFRSNSGKSPMPVPCVRRPWFSTSSRSSRASPE